MTPSRRSGSRAEPRSAQQADGASELRLAVDRLGRLLASRRAYGRLISAAGSDLTQQSSMLLTSLYLHGATATVSDLATMTRLDLSAASRQLRSLERAALVERSADEKDRRVIHLRLTAEGRKMAKRLVDTRRGHLERAVADWPAEKRLAFAAMLNELVDALTGNEVDPGADPHR